MKTQIQGRYGVSGTIEEVSPDRFQIVVTEGNTCRFGSDDDGVTFVDPSGGPFMAIGYQLPATNKVIHQIECSEAGIFFITKPTTPEKP